MPRSLDDLRAARPDLGFALYAIEPGGKVTLEVFADKSVFTFTAATEAEAIDEAFPPEDAPVEETTQTEEPATAPSIFD